MKLGEIRTQILALLQAGSLQRAVEMAQQGISVDNQALFCHYILGYCAAANGKLETAASYLTAALREPAVDQRSLEPGDSQQAALSLARVYTRQRRKSAAVAILLGSINQHGIFPSLANDIGNLLAGSEAFDAAEQCYRAALSVTAATNTAQNNFGNLLILVGKADEGVNMLLRTLEIEPDNARTLSSLATAYDELGEVEQAEDCHRKALSMDAEAPKIHLNFALHLFRRQLVEEALPHYRYRFAARGEPPSALRQGTDNTVQGSLDDGSVVISEQGIGDEFHLLYLLAQIYRDGKWAYVGDPRLEAVFKENFPKARFIARDSFRHETNLLDRSSLYRLDNALWQLRSHKKAYQRLAIPGKSDSDVWQKRLQGLGDGLKIGVSFSGGIRKRDHLKRNMPAEFWAGLAGVQNAQLIDIQYNDLPEPRTEISRSTGMQITRFAEYDPLTNLTHSLGLLDSLDSIISVDNSNAHLAGVFGLNATVLLNKAPNWRWGLDSRKSHLYPTLTLLRQARYGDWQSIKS